MESARPDRVLVIGGTGFIGAQAVARAAAQGAAVASLSRGAQGPPAAAVHFSGDAARPGVLASAAEAFRPDALVFALSAFTPRTEVAAGAAGAQAELAALDQALALAGEAAVRRLVYLSSAGTLYGDAAGTADERTLPQPKSLYGRMKLEGERRIAQALQGSSCRWSSLRVSNPYGPGQDPDGPQGVVAIFAGRLLRGQPCQVIAGSVRDYLYIDDLGRAIVSALAAPGNEPLNVASGRSLDAAELLSLIAARLGAAPPQVLPAAAGTHEVGAVRLDASRARDRLGWRAEVELEDGLDRTIAWLRARG